MNEKNLSMVPEVPATVENEAERIRKSGGTPRFYINRYGNVSVMNVAKIGRARGQKARQIQCNHRSERFTKGLTAARARIAEMDALDKAAGMSPPQECPLHAHAEAVHSALSSGLICGDNRRSFEALAMLETLISRLQKDNQ